MCDNIMAVHPITCQIKLLSILQLFAYLLFSAKMEGYRPTPPTSASSLTILRMKYQVFKKSGNSSNVNSAPSISSVFFGACK